MVEEIWKDVVGYEELFMVSNFGNIWSKRTKKILKQRKNDQRRMELSTKIGGRTGKVKTFLVHRLVATAFIENPDNKPEVNHIDGVPHNNCVENLEWVTHEENIQHGVMNKLFESEHRLGENHHCAVLTNEQREYIRSVYVPYSSVYGTRALGRLFDVDHSTIVDILKRK